MTARSPHRRGNPLATGDPLGDGAIRWVTGLLDERWITGERLRAIGFVATNPTLGRRHQDSHRHITKPP